MESDIKKKKKKGYVMPCRTDCDWGNCGLEYLGHDWWIVIGTVM